MIRYNWVCGKKYQYVEFSPSDIAELEATGYTGCFSLEAIEAEINKHMGGCEFSEDGTWPHEFKRIAEAPPNQVMFHCVHNVKAKGIDPESYFAK